MTLYEAFTDELEKISLKMPPPWVKKHVGSVGKALGTRAEKMPLWAGSREAAAKAGRAGTKTGRRISASLLRASPKYRSAARMGTAVGEALPIFK